MGNSLAAAECLSDAVSGKTCCVKGYIKEFVKSACERTPIAKHHQHLLCQHKQQRIPLDLRFRALAVLCGNPWQNLTTAIGLRVLATLQG